MSGMREPLLRRERVEETKPEKLGPLEISRSTRYGILAGIWMGTFLSVCIAPSHSTSPCSRYLTLLNPVVPEQCVL